MVKPPSIIRPFSIESGPEPPVSLGEAGRQLWLSIQSEYRIVDSGGRALLEQACAALDRASECERRIAVDGMVIETKNGPKDHPLIRHELAARALMARLLVRLGINFEPVRPPGRPAGLSVGIAWDQLGKR